MDRNARGIRRDGEGDGEAAEVAWWCGREWMLALFASRMMSPVVFGWSGLRNRVTKQAIGGFSFVDGVYRVN